MKRRAASLIMLAMVSVTKAGDLGIGIVPTSLLEQSNQVVTVGEVARLRGQAAVTGTPQLTAALEIPAVTLLPSNARIGRVSSQSWTVFTYDIYTGYIVPNAEMVLGTLHPRPNSGGHDHDDASRPTGALSAYSGNTGPTGLDLRITYTAPEVSGDVLSPVDCWAAGGYRCLPDQYYLFTTGVPGLVDLPAGTTYDLIGVTASHGSNHWVTASFRTKLQDFANAHFLRFGTTGTPRVAFNDISLQSGGLFDLRGNWTTPHSEHRVGLTADMRTPPPARNALLQQMLVAAGITGPLLIHVPPDQPHWHIRETVTRE